MWTSGDTTTFWPMLQCSPMRLFLIIREKCQIFVPGPISQGSSTYEDGCTKCSVLFAVGADIQFDPIRPGSTGFIATAFGVSATPSRRHHFLSIFANLNWVAV